LVFYPTLALKLGANCFSMSKDSQSQTKKFKFWQNILLGLLSILIFFLIGEAVIRISGAGSNPKNLHFLLNPELSYPQFYLKDKTLFWKFRPNQTIKSNFFVEGVYQINSYGLRDLEFSKEKRAGTFRVICLGNSCTFGWRVKSDETYPKQLEKLLNEDLDYKKYEVINGGVTGYSSFQGKRFLREQILKYKPDIITICYGWNDLLPAAFGIEDKNQKMAPQIFLDIQNLLGQTELYRFIRGLILSRFQVKKTGSSSEMLPRVSPEDFVNNLLEIALIASQENIPVIFLTTPIASLEAFWGPGKVSKTHQWHQVYNNVILNLPLSSGAYLIDVAALFENRKDVYDNPQDDFIHYNSAGHKLIAENLYNFLEQNKLIYKQAALTLK